MNEEFAVVLKNNLSEPAVFEGTATEVLAWIEGRRNFDVYLVWSYTRMIYLTAAEFLLQFQDN